MSTTFQTCHQKNVYIKSFCIHWHAEYCRFVNHLVNFVAILSFAVYSLQVIFMLWYLHCTSFLPLLRTSIGNISQNYFQAFCVDLQPQPHQQAFNSNDSLPTNVHPDWKLLAVPEVGPPMVRFLSPFLQLKEKRNGLPSADQGFFIGRNYVHTTSICPALCTIEHHRGQKCNRE